MKKRAEFDAHIISSSNLYIFSSNFDENVKIKLLEVLECLFYIVLGIFKVVP